MRYYGITSLMENILALKFTKPFRLILLFILGSSYAFGQIPQFSPDENAGIKEVIDIGDFYGHGASAADYDNDGDIDIYLCTKSSIFDRLYRNDGDGHFTDVARSLGIENSGFTRTALWFDYNGDKLLDLVTFVERCSRFNCGQPFIITLHEQQDDGSFIERSAEAGLGFGEKYDDLGNYAAGGLAAGDLNNDNYLDLIVAVWGGQLTVYMNNGDGTFEDQSVSSGLGVTQSYYWQPMIMDFDGDGHADIFCNVDFGPNQFWLNSGNNSFNEIGGQIGLAVDNSEMGMTMGDIDNDGDLDIYATNITRTFQGSEERNVLLRNDSQAGFLVFTETAKSMNVSEGGWDWGTTFVDLNNDGWVDLANTNGYNNNNDWGIPDQSRLFLNTKGSFADISLQSKFNDMLSATTLIAIDYDRDGDMDLFQTLKDNDGTQMPAILYQNDLQQTQTTGVNYIVVKPRMSGPNHFAIGSRVTIRSGDLTNIRLISAGTSFYAQEPAEAFFGLGENEVVDEITVQWPAGEVSVYTDIPANQVVTLNYEIVDTPEITGAVLSDEGLEVHWSDRSSNETGFILQKSTTRSFTEFTEYAIDANTTSYVDMEYNGSIRYYRVRAYNTAVSSPFCEVFSSATITAAETPLSDSFVVFPNPVKNKFTLQFENNFTGNFRIEILDVSGRKLISSDFHKQQFRFETDFEISLTPGHYLLNLHSSDQLFQRKLVVKD